MPRATVDGWELAYDEQGSGTPVVLLHGLLMDRSMWDHQTRAMVDRHRVITVDAPGHGESPPRPPGYTLEDEAGALLALADRLGVQAAVWGGHSMGGMKAMRIALAHPERVRGLVLIDTQPFPEDQDAAAQYDAMLQVAKADGVGEDLAAVIGSIMFHPTFAASAGGRDWIKQWTGLRDEIEGAARAVFDRGDISARLGEIAAPTLVIHGADDTPIPVEVARRYAPMIRGAKLVEVAGAGHTSPCENPALVSRAILTFLEAAG